MYAETVAPQEKTGLNLGMSTALTRAAALMWPATSNVLRRRALERERLELSTLPPEQHAQAPAGGLHCSPYGANPRWIINMMCDSVLRCYWPAADPLGTNHHHGAAGI